jgi:single-stranded-DNA-specific exonuclease
MFSVTLEEFPYKVGDTVDLAVKLSENEFQGKVQVSIQAKAIKLSGVDDDEAIASIHAYEDFCAEESISDELKNKISVNRELCGSVYKFVKANNGWNFSAEVLCYRLGLSPKQIAACQISLDALTELGILNLKDGKYTIPAQTVKNPLENSKIFQKIVL